MMARFLIRGSRDSSVLYLRLFRASPSKPSSPNGSPINTQLSSCMPKYFRGFFSAAIETLSRSHGASKCFQSRTFSSLRATSPIRSAVSELRVSRASKGRRVYFVDSRGYEHFQGRGLKALLETPDGKRRARQYAIILIAFSCLCLMVYATHLEVVPYTYRKHFVLLSPQFEVRLVQDQFEALKKQWKSVTLPQIHPQSIRVRKIAKDIIQAVMEGANTEGGDSHEPTEDKLNVFGDGRRDVVVWTDSGDLPSSGQWEAKGEVLNDGWVGESRSKGLKEGLKPFVDHLKLMKWEILVVDKDIVNAFCLPGGKIVVYTGLLRRFPSDAEVATVLGHEVSHVVARHSAERLTRHFFLTIIELFFLAFFYAPDLVRSVSVLFLELPFSRSQELEADHIGLLLMAAAGYDPQVAPRLYQKLGELSGSSDLLQYVTTHPSGKKRGDRLTKTGTMEQALKIYSERSEGKAVEGFLSLS